MPLFIGNLTPQLPLLLLAAMCLWGLRLVYLDSGGGRRGLTAAAELAGLVAVVAGVSVAMAALLIP